MLIYVPQLTNRLGYTLKVIFRHVMKVDFDITTDADTFLQRPDGVLCYSPSRIGEKAVWVKPSGLLFQNSIEEQEPLPFVWEGMHVLYPVYGKGLEIKFDPFSAAFYMLSRYEEYLPHHRDQHGRFLAAESIAYQEGFLEMPVVEQWAERLRKAINERFPEIAIPKRKFDMYASIDIDAAYCYRNKGFFRTLAGIAKDIHNDRNLDRLKRRMKVLARKEQDPFDTFDYILNQNKIHPGYKMVFFVLLGDYGVYDKSISHHSNEFQELIKHLGDYAKIGIHTSYAAFDEPDRIEMERSRLEQITNRNIVRNRSHFLRLQLPATYRLMERNGIRHDYTMGYAETPGYRAGISVQYPFFNLERDSEMEITVHPFCVMEATLKRYLSLSPEEGLERMKRLMDNTAAVGGCFCSIWHNENLCEDFGWQGWRHVFDEMYNHADRLKADNDTEH